LRDREYLEGEVQLLEGSHVIGVFSVTLVRKSSAVRPLNEIVARLGAVPATGPAVHVVVLEVPPSLFEFGTPEVLPAYTGIAPGKIVVMEAVIFVGGHPVPTFGFASSSFLRREHISQASAGWAILMSFVPGRQSPSAFWPHDRPGVRAALELPQSIEAMMTLCSPAGPMAATQALLSFNSSWIIRWVSAMPFPARCWHRGSPLCRCVSPVDQVGRLAPNDDSVITGHFHFRPEKPPIRECPKNPFTGAIVLTDTRFAPGTHVPFRRPLPNRSRLSGDHGSISGGTRS